MNARIAGAALAVAVSALLAGCSGGSGSDNPDTDDDIATLVSAGPTQPATSPATQERPLIRSDTSEAEEERLYGLYYTCVEKASGLSGEEWKKTREPNQGGPTSVAKAPDPVEEAKTKKAEKECADKEPEKVWERAKRLDPAYADKLRDWVTCIRSHGINAWESDGFLSFESLPSEDKMEKVDECEDKAFGVR